ncbi:HAMP domain-containing sensor histidine kinase [Clostridium sp. OS1-26]|uniref:sensor histidine kinase n=1 Tax=Clostridium sp. OS1-26 TaxID=3070681 RepID=UPI0027DFEE8C|nr:HAMP domain-containing sensor histidine kinase [Clostridium sp. OS1-26]WML34217.1 HAMP domain-containing sensor histidine kinase [Clostridium sp. OS1-26]
MDTKLTNKLKNLKSILIGSLLRQIIIMVILTILAGIFSIDLIENNGLMRLTNNETVLKQHLMEDSFPLSQKLYCTTDYLEKLKNGEIKQSDIERDFKDFKVKFALINNKNGKVYTNLHKVADLKDPFNEYIKQNSYYYYKADNEVNYAPIIEKDLDRREFLKSGKNFTEYYWYDKTGINAKVDTWATVLGPSYKALIELIFVFVWLIVTTVFIIRKVEWVKTVGKESAKRELKKSRLYFIILKTKELYYNWGVCEKTITLSSIAIMLMVIFAFLIDYMSYYKCIGFIILYIAYILGCLLTLIKDVKYFRVISKGTKEIAKGNFDLYLDTKGNIDLSNLAENINSIKIGYKKALEEHVKNERLKSELISNVSHDLKTPLTSIITYVDLLKREDSTEEEKEDYIKILDSKAKKLKVLIDDLFEVSKINSGKLELDKEKVDIVDLIYQVLGECSNCYEEKHIDFKLKSFASEVVLNLDGKQISRVIENVVYNALKYSMENTRVYINIENKANEVIISFKNIAAYEMNFDVEEIFERFKRGDESRNSEVEGSGLGLAISKSIVELHGGKMYIEKEGDLFKVFIVLKLQQRGIINE